jgi:hypothetical protein
MWFKVVADSAKSQYIVGINGSIPAYKIPLFKYEHSVMVGDLVKSLALIPQGADIVYDKSWLSDKDLQELPTKDVGDIFDSLARPKENKPMEPIVKEPKPDTVHETPNQGDRGATINALILHNTAGGFSGSVSWLCNPKSKVSAHLVVGRQGQVAQIVPFSKRAWHAGSGRWNGCSIGIEIEATDKARGLTAAQELKLVEWCRFLMKKYGIKKDMVLAHRMVSNTDCPVLIWPTDEQFNAWVAKNL